MADPRFHKRAGPFSVRALAELAGAEIVRGPHELSLTDVAPLGTAGPEDLSFLDNIRYKQLFSATKAGACIVAPAMQNFAPEGVALLVSDNPYKSYALAAQAFYPEALPRADISPNVFVSPDAEIGDGCRIDHGAVIFDGAQIGAHCHIEANAVVEQGVVIGAGCRIGANASISHSLIGNHVRIYPGCRIGQDGFGFAIDPSGFVKVPQLGRVIIGDGVEIGANTTIDRGAGPDTEIGAGTWIDNLVQIGHNVKIGRGCVIVAQVGISGSAVIEDFVMIGGQAGVAGHLRIGKGAKIGAQSGVMRDVAASQEMLGSPAQPIKQAMRQIAALGRLVKKSSNI